MTQDTQTAAPTPTPATGSPSFWTLRRPEWGHRCLVFLYGGLAGSVVTYVCVLLGQLHYATH